ncbi:MAG: response regulator transcription factor [Candidatus Latescibacteria bacterium]|nr:response regulator transcription factor [Candidatus Latescibacterota bacterium]
MTKALVKDYLTHSQDTGEHWTYHSLTPREREILKLLAEGYTNEEIADLLARSVKTIETHRAHLMEKLDLHDRVELVRYAIRHGLIQA